MRTDALENTLLKDDIRQHMHEVFTVFRNDISQLLSKNAKRGGGGGEEFNTRGGGEEGELPPVRNAKEESRERIRSRRAEARARQALEKEVHGPGSVFEGGGEGGEGGVGMEEQ
jgi:hypothetical protein